MNENTHASFAYGGPSDHEALLSVELAVHRYGSHSQFVGALLDRIRLAAKLLADMEGITRSKALDALAGGLGFSAWHALHKTATAPFKSEDRAQIAQDPRWGPLGNAWLLFGKRVNVEELTDAMMARMTAFTERKSGPGAGRSMLTVFAVLHPGPTDMKWTFPTTSDLYAFDPVRGAFIWSSACHELVDALDEQWQGYSDFEDEHKKQARAWVENILARHPEFLEAGLALAQMVFDSDVENAMDEAALLALVYTRKAEALMPEDFKGTMTWDHFSNRFYLRLLYLGQRAYQYIDPRIALGLARKQLSLNPGDHLGNRYALPLLQLRLGDVAGAQSSSKRFLTEDGPTVRLMLGFVAHAAGDLATFRRETVRSVLRFPHLRRVLENSDKPLPDGDPGSRGINDLAVLEEFLLPMYFESPQLELACLALLGRPEMVDAEAELWRYWRGFWRVTGAGRGTPAGNYEGWERLLAGACARLSE